MQALRPCRLRRAPRLGRSDPTQRRGRQEQLSRTWPHVSAVALVVSGALTDRLARQVIEGDIAGEGAPAQVIESRGLHFVSDDGALIEAIDAALAAQPDVLEKIREGKVQAARAVIGAVMKSMGGKADAARVRELVLEREQVQLGCSTRS